MKRRSLSNPPERTDNKRSIQPPKFRGSSVDGGSHIPRPRHRSSSTDRLSDRKSSLFRQSGKVSLGQHGLATPKGSSYQRSTLLMSAARNARSPSAERASILIQGKGPRKDTRPISDKAFQVQMLRKIDNYFHSIKQSSMLNANGSLKPMSIKMFIDVSSLLLGLLGVKQTLNNVNYVEEMPFIAKKLHYPGPMSKAWLKTANAMHALPNALAWLSWLVELCEVKDYALEHFSMENLPFTSINDLAEKNQNLFLSMIDMYTAWSENTELEETLTTEYLQRVEARYDVGEEKYESARKAYEDKKRESENEEKARAKIDAETKQLEEILANLKQDSENIEEYFQEQDEVIKKLSDENERIENDCHVLDKDIEKNLKLQEQLKQTIATQPISIAERDQIIAKCNDTQKFLKEFDIHLDDIQKDIYSRDMKLSSANHNLMKMVLQYNRDIHNHLSGISSDDLAKIEMPENISNPQSIKMLADVSLALTRLKEKKIQEREEMEKQLKDDEIELENLQEQARVLSDNNEEFARVAKEREAEINQIKAQAKLEEAELREKIKKLQENLKSMQESRKDLAGMQKELEERIEKRDALIRQKEHIEKRGVDFFGKFFSIEAAHKEKLEKLLNSKKKK